jgi:Mg2+/Co2+ transporter CorB
MANKTAKLMAILALLWILISVIWTWILFFMGWTSKQEQQISKEELQKLLQDQKIEITSSGAQTQKTQ